MSTVGELNLSATPDLVVAELCHSNVVWVNSVDSDTVEVGDHKIEA